MADEPSQEDILKEDDPRVAPLIEGLKKKNHELLGKVKEFQATAKKFEGIDPEQYAELVSWKTKYEKEQEEKQRKKQEEEGDFKRILSDTETKYQQQQTKLQEELAAKDQVIHKLVVTDGLRAALTKANVTIPAYQQAAMAMLQGRVKLTEADGSLMAEMDLKPLDEAIAEWASSDEGKFFVTAPQNSGTGSKPGNGSGGTGVKRRKEMTANEKSAFIKEHGLAAFEKLPF